METAAALARLGQFAAAMVLGGGAAFLIYGYDRDRRAAWPGRMLLAAAVLGAISTLAWLWAQAANLEASMMDVTMGTGFGKAAAVRVGLFVVAMLTARSWSASALLGLAASASFAWTGHGSADDGTAGLIHQAGDVVHLVSAALWLGALPPLGALAIQGRPDVARRAMEAFSGVGPAVVAVLVLSGLVNGWFLVGPAHVLQLPQSPWGVLMLVKLALFAAMLGLAAANRWVVTPALARGGIEAARASLAAETALGFGVLACVAWLGTMAPPAAG